MSTGARGLTLLRARPAPSVAASTVAWELAARARFDGALAAGREALATLAFDVAEGVLGRAVAVDPAVVEALAAQALAGARAARRLLVCAHPDDVPAARAALAAALADGADVEWAEVAADPGLARGCVAVETPGGRVVADWAASLSLARERWLASLAGTRP